MNQSSPWILGPKKDLLFISCCTILTPISFLIYATLSQPGHSFGLEEATVGLVMWIIFEGLFDTPHIFKTFARTHQDKTEFQRHKFFHTYGIIALLILGFSSMHFNFYGELYFAVAIIGSWHIFKQNVGFLKLYCSKAKQSLWVKRADLFFFYSLYFYYISGFFFKDDIDVWKAIRIPLIPYLKTTESLLFTTLILAGVICFLANFYQSYKAKSIAVAKLSFIIPLTLTYIFLRHIILLCPLIIIIIAETIYHDVQYHTWMNYYEEKRYKRKVPFLNKWFLFSLLYGAFFVTIDILLDHTQYISIIGFMIILYHYLADGFIWKFSQQHELKELIK